MAVIRSGYVPKDHPMFNAGFQFSAPQLQQTPATKPAPSPSSSAPPQSESVLFKRCRKVLGLTLPAMARALLIASDRNLRRWEDGTRPVSGPAWVALEYMLREAGEIELADQVTEVVERRRGASAQRAAQTEPSAC